jgi:hypothetical protein
MGTSSVNGGFFRIYVIYVSLLPWCLVSMARISSTDSYADYFETIRQGICNNYSNNYHIIMLMIYNQNIFLIYTIIP